MNKKDYKFLESKLLELTKNDIISNEQYSNAKEYFNNEKENRSITTIFTAIGVLLIALSIITLFPINWANISKEIKIIVSFIPIITTSILLYLYMKDQNKKMQIYTSIFAPISIIATNSLIAQIFHIQTEIYELIFISVIMFLPIAFILRNYISIVVYGIGTIIYAFSAINLSVSENIGLFNTIILSIPLIIYNIVNYKKNKTDGKNIAMWAINVILVTLLLFFKEIFRPDVLLIYLYMIYFITKTIFEDNNTINKLLSFLFVEYLVISCTTPFIISYAEDIKFGFDTVFITLITATFIYLSKSYKEPKEYFIFLFILLLQYLKINTDILFILINIIAVAFGVYKIILGNQSNSYKQIKQGVSLILLLILFRFINSDISFIEKGIMFFIAGISFIVGSNVMKKRIGGNDNE